MPKPENLSEESLACYLQDSDRVKIVNVSVGTVVVHADLAVVLADLSMTQQKALAMLFEENLMDAVSQVSRHLEKKS